SLAPHRRRHRGDSSRRPCCPRAHADGTQPLPDGRAPCQATVPESRQTEGNVRALSGTLGRARIEPAELEGCSLTSRSSVPTRRPAEPSTRRSWRRWEERHSSFMVTMWASAAKRTDRSCSSAQLTLQVDRTTTFTLPFALAREPRSTPLWRPPDQEARRCSISRRSGGIGRATTGG